MNNKKYYFVVLAEDGETLHKDWVDLSNNNLQAFLQHTFDTYEPNCVRLYTDETCTKQVLEAKEDLE